MLPCAHRAKEGHTRARETENVAVAARACAAAGCRFLGLMHRDFYRDLHRDFYRDHPGREGRGRSRGRKVAVR